MDVIIIFIIIIYTTPTLSAYLPPENNTDNSTIFNTTDSETLPIVGDINTSENQIQLEFTDIIQNDNQTFYHVLNTNNTEVFKRHAPSRSLPQFYYCNYCDEMYDILSNNHPDSTRHRHLKDDNYNVKEELHSGSVTSITTSGSGSASGSSSGGTIVSSSGDSSGIGSEEKKTADEKPKYIINKEVTKITIIGHPQRPPKQPPTILVKEIHVRPEPVQKILVVQQQQPPPPAVINIHKPLLKHKLLLLPHVAAVAALKTPHISPLIYAAKFAKYQPPIPQPQQLNIVRLLVQENHQKPHKTILVRSVETPPPPPVVALSSIEPENVIEKKVLIKSPEIIPTIKVKKILPVAVPTTIEVTKTITKILNEPIVEDTKNNTISDNTTSQDIFVSKSIPPITEIIREPIISTKMSGTSDGEPKITTNLLNPLVLNTKSTGTAKVSETIDGVEKHIPPPPPLFPLPRIPKFLIHPQPPKFHIHLSEHVHEFYDP